MSNTTLFTTAVVAGVRGGVSLETVSLESAATGKIAIGWAGLLPAGVRTR